MNGYKISRLGKSIETKVIGGCQVLGEENRQELFNGHETLKVMKIIWHIPTLFKVHKCKVAFIDEPPKCGSTLNTYQLMEG
jgi:hypothetical protein